MSYYTLNKFLLLSYQSNNYDLFWDVVRHRKLQKKINTSELIKTGDTKSRFKSIVRVDVEGKRYDIKHISYQTGEIVGRPTNDGIFPIDYPETFPIEQSIFTLVVPDWMKEEKIDETLFETSNVRDYFHIKQEFIDEYYELEWETWKTKFQFDRLKIQTFVDKNGKYITHKHHIQFFTDFLNWNIDTQENIMNPISFPRPRDKEGNEIIRKQKKPTEDKNWECSCGTRFNSLKKYNHIRHLQSQSHQKIFHQNTQQIQSLGVYSTIITLKNLNEETKDKEFLTPEGELIHTKVFHCLIRETNKKETKYSGKTIQVIDNPTTKITHQTPQIKNFNYEKDITKFIQQTKV